jgi:hypothetical protein
MRAGTWLDYENKVFTDNKWVERPARDRPIAGICMAHGNQIEAPTAIALAGLCTKTRAADLMLATRQGQDPAAGRNEAAKMCLEHGADWLLFIDQDMTFPPEALDRLLAHDVDIVGIDYRKRSPPYAKIGVPEPGEEEKTTGLAKYVMWGLGLVLVRRRAFFQIPRPWFAREYNPSGYMTEDHWFCERARAIGLTVWCDLDLTAQCCHVGQQPVPWNIPNAP